MKAFPGAEGFGANSVGGRGGTVYEVTNTDNSGTGSLREAVEASGARTVVFRTGGTITLTSQLRITNPYITIAGQTAPGGGICLKSEGTFDGECFNIGSHNVIIRHLRFRQGAMTSSASSRDSLFIGSSSLGTVYDVIVDHCSMSWSVDENVSTAYDPYNVTIQWCIISEGLYDSNHASGYHSMGILLNGGTNISIHHSLFAHNNSRSPRISNSGTVDFVNNVIYNPGSEMGTFDNEAGNLFVNYVGNYARKGGDSDDGDYEVRTSDPTGSNTYSIYVSGNIGPNRATDDLAENLVVETADRIYVTTTRNAAPLVTTTSAAAALTAVLADAGASKKLSSLGVFSNNRDSVDTRVVADVTAVTGSIIDDPSEVGGWPVLTAGTAPKDSDSDGMPDDWEKWYGLNPSDSDDNIIDTSRDGYDNLEGYLNGVYRAVGAQVTVQTTYNLWNSVTGVFGGKYGREKP